MPIHFKKEVSIRWSDIDPNFHLRHSVYYDFGAQQRIEILEEVGLSLNVMQEVGFGPIIFREECIFKREVRLSDIITITAKIAKMRADGSRWTIQHVFTNLQNVECATLNIDGAWMDTKKRKLCNPTPQIVVDVLNAFPRSEGFVEE
jgi:acyl-CoA thioester hydrolase